jgi:hypothetical protein
LLHVDQETSHKLIDEITLGDLIRKPGWIRMSVHPTTMQRLNLSVLVLKLWPKIIKQLWIIPIVEILMSLSTKRHNH